MTLIVNGQLTLEHTDLGQTDVVIDGGLLTLIDSAVGDIQIIDGTLKAENGEAGVIDVTDGSIVGSRLTCNNVTVASAVGSVIQVNGWRCASLTIAGGSSDQSVRVDELYATGRLITTGTFEAFTITSAILGDTTTSTTFASGGLVDFTDLATFRFEGSLIRAWRNAIRLEDCVAGHVDVHIVDPGVQADNTHDAVNLVGACGQLYLAGTVYGAVNQANNPRYALAAAAGTTAPVDVFMSMAGYQTGAVNDASGNVVVH